MGVNSPPGVFPGGIHYFSSPSSWADPRTLSSLSFSRTAHPPPPSHGGEFSGEMPSHEARRATQPPPPARPFSVVKGYACPPQPASAANHALPRGGRSTLERPWYCVACRTPVDPRGGPCVCCGGVAFTTDPSADMIPPPPVRTQDPAPRNDSPSLGRCTSCGSVGEAGLFCGRGDGGVFARYVGQGVPEPPSPVPGPPPVTANLPHPEPSSVGRCTVCGAVGMRGHYCSRGDNGIYASGGPSPPPPPPSDSGWASGGGGALKCSLQRRLWVRPRRSFQRWTW